MPANIAESYWVSNGVEQADEDELAQSAQARLNGNQGQWDWKHSGVWTYLAPAGVQLPPQGWKLHISATSRRATRPCERSQRDGGEKPKPPARLGAD